MKHFALWLAATSLLGAGCAHVSQEMAANDALVGAWRSQVRFTSGAFASIRDLECDIGAEDHPSPDASHHGQLRRRRVSARRKRRLAA